ncbi:MAG TPA: DNA polymerase III subunit delta [Proteobacteria bacterium]|nr:DNA polymerase III subunit delta [Pseudomonadota bacterium]
MLKTLDEAFSRALTDTSFWGCLLYGSENYPHAYLSHGLKTLADRGQVLEIFDCSQLSLPDFRLTCATPSFFAASKIVHLYNLDQFAKNDLEKLLEWIEREAPRSPVRALFLSSFKLDGRSFLVSRLKKKDFFIVKSDKMKPAEVRQRLLQRLQEHEIAIDGKVLDELVLLHDANLPMLESELEKMELYVGPGGRIDRRTADLLGVDSGGGNIFAFCDAVCEGQLPRSLEILEALLRARTEPLLILAMLARQYRLLGRAASPELQRLTSSKLAEALKIHPYVAGKLLTQVKRMKPMVYAPAFKIMLEVDRALKRSLLPSRLILEDMVLQLVRVATAK